jgi:hypothetical protein
LTSKDSESIKSICTSRASKSWLLDWPVLGRSCQACLFWPIFCQTAQGTNATCLGKMRGHTSSSRWN